MRQSAQQGNNQTGMLAAGERGQEMLEGTPEFRPSSPGSAQAIAAVRMAYAQEGEGLGETPPTLLMDKLGERLAFERAGARLYEALLSKYEAYGSFDGGPSGDELLHILTEEYEHADVLEAAIKTLGGDPTVLTPSANLTANISAGLPQVMTDPRTNLLQSLEAIVVAELADNECWPALAQLAGAGGHDQLVEQCVEAIRHERDHLRSVRMWIAAGQARAFHEEDGAEMPEVGETGEFTFAEDGPVDREGYVMSEEERQTDQQVDSRGSQTGKSEKGGSRRRQRSPKKQGSR